MLKDSFKTCYRTTQDELAAFGNQFVFTVDLLAKYLVDGFLLVEGTYNGYSYVRSPDTHNEFLFDYSVFVGNSTNWQMNAACPGAPFMTFEKDGSEQSGWIFDPLT